MISAGARVLGYARVISDTVSRATLPESAAVVVAKRALGGMGFAAESLVFVGDSSLTRAARTDHFLSWRLPGTGFRGLAGDTATRRVRVAVLGDSAERVQRLLHIPRGSARRLERDDAASTIGNISPLVVMGCAVLALIITVSRQRADVLAWPVGTRLLLASLALLTPSLAVSSWQGVLRATSTSDAIFSGVLGVPLLVGFIGGVALAAFVAAESLAAEFRPAMFAGVRELARGRVMIPETATAVFRGVAWGIVAMATFALVTRLSILVFGAPVDSATPMVGEGIVPGVAMAMGFGVPVASAIVFGVVLGIQRKLPLGAVILAVAVTGGVFATLSPPHWSELLVNIASVAVLALCAWHSGFLATAVAAAILFTVPQIDALIRSSGASAIAGSLALSVAMALLPLALGVVVYRRMRTVRG